MYDIVDYGAMIQDTGRTSAYARALEATVTPGAVVLDIGTGSGILALLACRAGAARVYAVDPSPVIQFARDAAAANGFADRIQFIQALSTDIALPEQVDGIVAEIPGVLPLFSNSLFSILDARKRFLKPGGWMLPARETIWGTLISSPSEHKRFAQAWETEYGFDLSSARARAVNHWRRTTLKSHQIAVPPQAWGVLDYLTLEEPDLRGELSWVMDREAVVHGIGLWFDAEMAPGLGFSNSPASAETHIYKHAFFPWPDQTRLAATDRVAVHLRADFVESDYVWTWQTRIEDAAGAMKARHRQSSFYGEPLPADRLRRRAHTFVPEPNEHARIDRLILELMERKLSLGDIATQLVAAFPSRFIDWNDALSRAGDVVDRYRN